MENNNKPLVSIGMPAYNGIKFIKRAIDSLLSQTYENFEFIISDNYSEDGTWELLDEYAKKDKRIKLHRQEKNIGMFGNFDFVLTNASGKYFMWAAVDDFWTPEFIDYLVADLEKHKDAGVSMCAVGISDEHGTRTRTVRFNGTINPNTTSHLGMLINATSYKKHKFNYFIYGIFKTEIIKSAMKGASEFPFLDRILISHITLACKLRYIDEIYHIRTIREVISHKRLPGEKFSKILNEDKYIFFEILYKLSQTILNSDIIKWYRKLYLPIAIWNYGLLLLRFFYTRRKNFS